MDRVDLAHQFGVERRRRWHRGSSQSWQLTSVTFGRLGDGRWFAGRSGHLADVDDKQQGACVFGADDQGEALALRLAYSWMREGQWRPLPAAYGADGRPTDGLPWVRRGGTWFLDA